MVNSFFGFWISNSAILHKISWDSGDNKFGIISLYFQIAAIFKQVPEPKPRKRAATTRLPAKFYTVVSTSDFPSSLKTVRYSWHLTIVELQYDHDKKLQAQGS